MDIVKTNNSESKLANQCQYLNQASRNCKLHWPFFLQKKLKNLKKVLDSQKQKFIIIENKEFMMRNKNNTNQTSSPCTLSIVSHQFYKRGLILLSPAGFNPPLSPPAPLVFFERILK